MKNIKILIIPIIQLIGLLFFHWDISDIIILYLAELVYLALSTIVKILLYNNHVRSNHRPADILISIAVKLYATFFFLISYGMMVIIGSFVALFAAQYDSRDWASSIHNNQPLIPSRLWPIIILVAIPSVIQTIEDIKAIWKNNRQAMLSYVYPYLQLGVFLVIIIAFFFLGVFKTDYKTWFSICFIVIKTIGDMFVLPKIMHRLK